MLAVLIKQPISFLRESIVLKLLKEMVISTLLSTTVSQVQREKNVSMYACTWKRNIANRDADYFPKRNTVHIPWSYVCQYRIRVVPTRRIFRNLGIFLDSLESKLNNNRDPNKQAFCHPRKKKEEENQEPEKGGSDYLQRGFLYTTHLL